MSKSNPSHTVSRCPKCRALLIVRSDQFGRKIRCAKCAHSFIVQQPSQPTIVQNAPEPEEAKEDNQPVAANMARAKMANKFEMNSGLVFRAVLQAIRSFNCDLKEVNHTMMSAKFLLVSATSETEHQLHVFYLSRGFVGLPAVVGKPRLSIGKPPVNQLARTNLDFAEYPVFAPSNCPSGPRISTPNLELSKF